METLDKGKLEKEEKISKDIDNRKQLSTSKVFTKNYSEANIGRL